MLVCIYDLSTFDHCVLPNILLVDEEGQEIIYNLVHKNLNLPNPFFIESIEFPINVENCPRVNDPSWLHIPANQIDTISEHIQIVLPELTVDQLTDLYSLTGQISPVLVHVCILIT